MISIGKFIMLFLWQWTGMLLLFISTFCHSQDIVKEDSLNTALTNATGEKRVKIMCQLAEVLAESKPKKAIDLTKEIQKYSTAINYPEGTANAYYYFGNIALNQGDYSNANAYFDSALTIFTKVNNKERISAVNNCIGSYYLNTGDLEKAVQYYGKAASISEEVNDYAGLANVTNNIGIIYTQQGKFDEALAYLKKSYNAHVKIKNKPGQGNNLNNIGLCYFHKKNYAEAEKFISQAIRIWMELKDDNGLAMSYNGYGTVKIEQGESKTSMEFFNKSYVLCKQTGNKFGMCKNLQSMSAIYSGNSEYEKAKEVSLRCVDIALELGVKSIMKDCYDQLYLVCSSMKDYKNALDYHVLFSAWKDSLINEESSGKIIEMQMKYESERKENEIKLLSKEKQVRDLEYKRKIEKQQILIYSFVIGFVVILIFSAWLFRMYAAKRNANIILEFKNSKINEQKQEIKAQRDLATEQRDIITAQNQEIISSINYAMQIQSAILPPKDYLDKYLPSYFILFKPRDIVSGDFYWAKHMIDVNTGAPLTAFCVADCTGHGVPGAFMSMLGIALLDEIVSISNVGQVHSGSNEKVVANSMKFSVQASDLLELLRKRITTALHQTGKDQDLTTGAREIRDGIDISLCIYNPAKKELQFAGANNSLYVVASAGKAVIASASEDVIASAGKAVIASASDDVIASASEAISITAGESNADSSIGRINSLVAPNDLTEIKADRFPIGIGYQEEPGAFTNHIIQLTHAHTIYLCSDGFSDQVGGPGGKKYMSRNFKQLLAVCAEKPFSEQQEFLQTALHAWMNHNSVTYDQTDDITVMGIKISL